MSIFDRFTEKKASEVPSSDISALDTSEREVFDRFAEVYIGMGYQSEANRKERQREVLAKFIEFCNIRKYDGKRFIHSFNIIDSCITVRTTLIRVRGHKLGVYTIDLPTKIVPPATVLWEAYSIQNEKKWGIIQSYGHPHLNHNSKRFCTGNAGEELILLMQNGDVVGIFSYFMRALHTVRPGFAFMSLTIEDWPIDDGNDEDQI